MGIVFFLFLNKTIFSEHLKNTHFYNFRNFSWKLQKSGTRKTFTLHHSNINTRYTVSYKYNNKKHPSSPFIWNLQIFKNITCRKSTWLKKAYRYSLYTYAFFENKSVAKEEHDCAPKERQGFTSKICFFYYAIVFVLFWDDYTL